MMDHLRIHHQDEFDAVVVANSKRLSLAAFKAQLKEPRVRAFLGNSSAGESAEKSHATPNATPNAGSDVGAALHQASMVRLTALQTPFVDTAAEQAGAPGKQRSVADMFKPSSISSLSLKLRICWDATSDLRWRHLQTWRLPKTCSMSRSFPRRSFPGTPIF
jgi:hypothetical protein